MVNTTETKPPTDETATTPTAVATPPTAETPEPKKQYIPIQYADYCEEFPDHRNQVQNKEAVKKDGADPIVKTYPVGPGALSLNFRVMDMEMLPLDSKGKALQTGYTSEEYEELPNEDQKRVRPI
ncbi:MAG: hypothetical protein AAGA60_10800 [Cyanobacteria bacterium P01_E01_bin.42]